MSQGNSINKNKMRHGIDQDIELDKMDNTSGIGNPYRELTVNNAGKRETSNQCTVPENTKLLQETTLSSDGTVVDT